MWKNLFGMSAFLISLGFVFRSLQPAYAEIGPSVSMGTNPVAHFSAVCSGSNTGVIIMNNNSSSDFILTDFIPQGGTYTLSINGSNIVVSGFGSAPISISSGLKVLAGESLKCTNNYGYRLFISGYYVQP